MNAKGMRRTALAGGNLHVFSDAKRIVVQVRATGPDHDPLATWAKAAVELDAEGALAVASELLLAASVLVKGGKQGRGKDGSQGQSRGSQA